MTTASPNPALNLNPHVPALHRLRELAVVSGVVLSISLVLWWRFLPLPHQDLNFYTEPAFLLAKFGRLAGPGSQYVDLTYQKGMYNYPPGHYLILAGWIRLFGFSADSLLAFTHVVHAGILLILWALLRFRYEAPGLITVLALLSIFPRMAHGRADLLGCLLSLAAWLALPEKDNPRRVVLSGCLAGATMLVSPGYGLTTIATLVLLNVFRRQIPLRIRLHTLAVWLLAAGSVFAGVLAAVLYLQNSWTLAYVQFKTNVAIRGAQVNVWPDFHLLFTWIFSVIPFFLLAVAPALVIAVATWRDSANHLRDVSLAFLGATVIWVITNRSPMLLDHHYLFPAKSIFLGLLCSKPRFPAWLRSMPLVLLTLIGFYYFKADFLYLTSPLRADEQRYSAGIQPAGEIAVDSLYFTRFYSPGHTLNYETVDMDFWPKYLAAIPPSLRGDILAGLQTHPVEPSTLLVSAYTQPRFGSLSHGSMPCTRPPEASQSLQILGRAWHLPAHPYALIVCTRERLTESVAEGSAP